MKRRRSHKGTIASALVILLGFAIWFGALLIGPSRVTIPQPLQSPVSTPSLVTGKPVPHVWPSKAVSPRSETDLYVVAKDVPSYWGVPKVIAGWNLATHTDFVPVAKCPSHKPCITIKMDDKLDVNTAAETSFGYRNDITIDLNPDVTRPREAQSTLCHEMGHTLGLPHISGTSNTCMTATDDFYRVLPSTLDLKLANSYGDWSLEKMYELSGKDLDARSLPK